MTLPKIKPIEWGEHEPPNKDSHYDHVFGTCSLGKFSIEWKSWKKFDSRTIYFCGEYIGNAPTLDEAKTFAFNYLSEKIISCFEV